MQSSIVVNLSLETVEQTIQAIQVLDNSLNRQSPDYSEYHHNYQNLLDIYQELYNEMMRVYEKPDHDPTGQDDDHE